MSYLFNFGKFDEAINLAQLLDDMGDKKKKKYIAKSISNYYEDLNDLSKLKLSVAARLGNMCLKHYSVKCDGLSNSNIRFCYITVINKIFFDWNTTITKVIRLEKDSMKLASKIRCTKELANRSRLSNKQDPYNKQT